MTDAEIIDCCFRGEISPQIAVSRLLLTGRELDVEHLFRVAKAQPASAPLASMARLADLHRDRLASLSRLARSGLWPEGEDVVAATAALFDRLAVEAPEAGVAFYTLGDSAELSAATAELTAVIRAWTPLAGRRVVDLGCGIGRVAAVLAEEAASVLGLDVSPGMIAEARRRSGARANLRFLTAEACALPAESAAVDLLVAVDCLPYVIGADNLRRFMGEAARVLARGADLLVFNWSYRAAPDRDVAEARAVAEAFGFELLRAGERPFAIWDATAFHLRRLS